VVLEGVIDYRRVEPDGQEFRKTLSKNDTIVSPKGQPHIFIALTDSLILEWTGLGKFQKEIYQPYRDIINAKM
jgi:hypothetical protein